VIKVVKCNVKERLRLKLAGVFVDLTAMTYIYIFSDLTNSGRLFQTGNRQGSVDVFVITDVELRPFLNCY